MSRKVGRPCPEGELCHWVLVGKLPKEDGTHLVNWQCEKCKFIEQKEVTIQ